MAALDQWRRPTAAENLNVAQLEVQMHDTESAALRLKTTPVDAKNIPDVAEAAMDRALLAEETGDLKAAAKEWDAYATAYANPTIATANPQLHLLCRRDLPEDRATGEGGCGAQALRRRIAWWIATASRAMCWICAATGPERRSGMRRP